MQAGTRSLYHYTTFCHEVKDLKKLLSHSFAYSFFLKVLLSSGHTLEAFAPIISGVTQLMMGA